MITVKDLLSFNKNAKIIVIINGKEVGYNLTWEDVEVENLTEDEKKEYESSCEDSRKVTKTVIIEIE